MKQAYEAVAELNGEIVELGCDLTASAFAGTEPRINADERRPDVKRR
jgi:hypothetical protein